jgi:hypothetical protein
VKKVLAVLAVQSTTSKYGTKFASTNNWELSNLIFFSGIKAGLNLTWITNNLELSNLNFFSGIKAGLNLTWSTNNLELSSLNFFSGF